MNGLKKEAASVETKGVSKETRSGMGVVDTEKKGKLMKRKKKKAMKEGKRSTGSPLRAEPESTESSATEPVVRENKDEGMEQSWKESELKKALNESKEAKGVLSESSKLRDDALRSSNESKPSNESGRGAIHPLNESNAVNKSTQPLKGSKAPTPSKPSNPSKQPSASNPPKPFSASSPSQPSQPSSVSKSSHQPNVPIASEPSKASKPDQPLGSLHDSKPSIASSPLLHSSLKGVASPSLSPAESSLSISLPSTSPQVSPIPQFSNPTTNSYQSTPTSPVFDLKSRGSSHPTSPLPSKRFQSSPVSPILTSKPANPLVSPLPLLPSSPKLPSRQPVTRNAPPIPSNSPASHLDSLSPSSEIRSFDRDSQIPSNETPSITRETPVLSTQTPLFTSQTPIFTPETSSLSKNKLSELREEIRFAAEPVDSPSIPPPPPNQSSSPPPLPNPNPNPNPNPSESWNQRTSVLNRMVFRCALSMSHDVDSVFLCLNTVRRVDLRGLCSLSFGSSRFVGWPMRRNGGVFSCSLHVKAEKDVFFGSSVEEEGWLSAASLPSLYFFVLLRRQGEQSVIKTSASLPIDWTQFDATQSATAVLPVYLMNDSLVNFSFKGAVLLQFVRLRPKSMNPSASVVSESASSSNIIASFSPKLTPLHNPQETDSVPSPIDANLTIQNSVPVPLDPSTAASSSSFFTPLPIADPSITSFQVFNSVPTALAVPMNVASSAGTLSYSPPFVILENGQLCWCISPTIMCPGFSSVLSDSSCVCSQTKQSKSLA